MAKINIRGLQCVDETGGRLELGSDEVVFFLAVFGVDASAYAEYRRFFMRFVTGLDDGDGPAFDEPIEFHARSRENGRPSYPLVHLEFHMAAYEIDGRDEAELARRLYERWYVAMAESYEPGAPTDVLREDFDPEGRVGSARRGMEIANDVRSGQQLIMVDSWRLDVSDPRSETFGAPGVGQSNGLYVGDPFHGIHRSSSGVERWSNDERTSERRTFATLGAESTYRFYVNYYDR